MFKAGTLTAAPILHAVLTDWHRLEEHIPELLIKWRGL